MPLPTFPEGGKFRGQDFRDLAKEVSKCLAITATGGVNVSKTAAGIHLRGSSSSSSFGHGVTTTRGPYAGWCTVQPQGVTSVTNSTTDETVDPPYLASNDSGNCYVFNQGNVAPTIQALIFCIDSGTEIPSGTQVEYALDSNDGFYYITTADSCAVPIPEDACPYEEE